MDTQHEISDRTLLEHIEKHYGNGWHGLAISNDRRFSAMADDGTRIVVNAYIVGPTNAGAYRHWLAMPKPSWGRVFGEKPNGWEHYILMVGLQPDGVSIWWSAMYDEQSLAQGDVEPEYVRSGFGRLPASVASFALAAPPVDELQVTFGFEQTQEVEIEVQTNVEAVGARALKDYPPGANVVLVGQVVKHNDGGTVTVAFGGKEWAVIGSVGAISV